MCIRDSRTSATASSRPSTPRRRSPTTRTNPSLQPQHPNAARSRPTPRVVPRPPAHPVPRTTRSSTATPTPSTSTLPLPEPAVGPNDDPHLRLCVEHYTHTDWARFELPSPTPDDLLDFVPSSRRPLLSEVLTLAAKAHFHDGTVLLVRRPPPPPPHPTDRAPPADLPSRVDVPMLMRPCVPVSYTHLTLPTTPYV